ncbi:MAG: DNA gyrase subunit A, partial [Clostridia bacterium]|nr:DNA gyrase subunit A [Clostridia bacterium]
VKERCNDARRTEISQMVDDIDLDDIIQEEEMCVSMTHLGYIKRLTPDTYRTQHRGGRGVMGQTTHEEDFVERLFVTSTHANLLFFTNFGRVFKNKCYTIPEAGRNAKGLPIVNLLQLGNGEKVTAILPIRQDETGGYLVMATRSGVIKKTALSDFENIRKGGLIALSLKEGDELIAVERSTGEDHFIVASRQGKCIRFDENDVRAMGRTATGVRSMELEGEDEVVSMVKVVPEAEILTVSALGMGKRTPESQYPLQKRGGKGVYAMQLTEKTGELTCLKVVTGEEDLMLIRDDGTLMRMSLDTVSTIGRNTQGVKLMRVDEGTRIAAVALAPRQEAEEEAPEGSEG